MKPTANGILYHNEISQQDIQKFDEKELETYDGSVQLIVDGSWSPRVVKGLWENLQIPWSKRVEEGVYLKVRFDRGENHYSTPQKPQHDVRTLIYQNTDVIEKVLRTFDVPFPRDLMNKPVKIHLDDLVCVGISRRD